MKLPDRFVWRPRDVLRELGDVLNILPYLAVLLVPFGFAAWAMGLGGNAAADEVEASWWFKGYLAMLLYIPSMAVCALLDRWSGRRGWTRLRLGVRVFRWAHLAVAFGPLVVLLVLVLLPSTWRPFR